MDIPAGAMLHEPEDEITKKEAEEGEEEEDDEEEEKELAVDVELLRDCFTPGVEGEVPLASYVKAYKELNKFVKLLGPLFTFVAYDVRSKVALLQKEMEGENSQYYVDLRTMMNFETEHDIVRRSSPLSGTDAFLMLHRALEFVVGFMQEMMEEVEEPPFGRFVSELYLSTVGRFHASILARMFSGVLLLLPDRASIRNKVTKGKEEAEETLRRLIPEAIRSVQETYEASQTLYCDHDLLDL